MKAGNVIKILLTVALMVWSIGLVSAQDGSGATASITLNENTITVDGTGATASGSIVTITSPGTYNVTGSLEDGQIIINTPDNGLVSLSLNGVTIGSASSVPMYIQKAETVAIVLADGTQNIITTGAAYASEEDALNAAIFSTANLIIEGSGSLTIEANAVDGIASSGSLTIDGTPTIAIHAGDDAIQVQTVFTIRDGELNLVAGGGSSNTLSEDLSGKGIKVEESVVIEGGSITIDAADDGIRSEKDLVMNEGSLTISVIGKAIHSSYNLEINDGDINVSTCDEGIEGGFITINGSAINLTATDDGINVSEPDDVPAPTLYYLHINGGYIVVNADGDGIDSNGSVEINGGVVLVNGPTAMDNGALDYDGTFNITGGFLVAAGSAGMPAAPSQTSSQHTVLINFDSALEAGTLVRIQSSDGEGLLTFAPGKTFQSVVFSAPELAEGTTYDVYYGGSSDGSATDGLYADGVYSPGTKQASFTVSDIVTMTGNMRVPGGMRPGGGGFPPPGQGQPPEGGFPPGGEGQPPKGNPPSGG